MTRLPLRARLTLAFGLAMAVVIAAIGLFVELRVSHSLRASVDQGLQARATDVAGLATQADNGLSTPHTAFAAPGSSFGQLIDAAGRVYDATPGLRRQPLLSGTQVRRGRHTSYFAQLRDPVAAGTARIFVAPIRAQGQALVLLVGTSLTEEQRALASLRTGLLIGGPAALLLASLGGYLLAGAALRPVERMRARAAGLSADSRGARLPVAPADDEVGRLGRTLNAMLARLEDARAREQQFLADASHELRTPLALLKTEIELALDEPRSAEQLRAALRSAGEETDRLVQLAEDLLLLAQTDNGKLPLRIERLEGRELADRLCARFAARVERAGRELIAEVAPGTSLVLDPLRIEQGVGNLIDNALRHGSGAITLRIFTRAETVEIHVSDEGEGIPPTFREAAFGRFTRDDNARPEHGTGLGLAIVEAIARTHHGQALIGDGADVYLVLPWRPGAPVATPPSATPAAQVS